MGRSDVTLSVASRHVMLTAPYGPLPDLPPLPDTNDKAQVGRTMKAAHQAAADFRGREVVKAGELIEARYAQGVSPSLAARKVLALLIGKAAGDAWRPGSHTITKRELRGSHKGNERLPDILDELMGVKFKLPTISKDGHAATLTAALIAWNIEETSDKDGAIVEWEFTEPTRRVLQGSDYYARMNRAALLSFRSKYALTLYEMGSLISGRRDPSIRLSIADFREKVGVEVGTLPRWPDLHRRVLDQAKAEIDQLAHFTLSWRETRQGKKVVEVELFFWRKAETETDAAADEVARPKVGREARRKGTVERIAPQQTDLEDFL